MITGHLTKNSPLRAIFTDGMVPLLSPVSNRAGLGEGDIQIHDVYMIALRQCTKEQRAAMAQRMAAMGQGPLEEAIIEVETKEELPVLVSHFSGVGMPLRAFI